MPSTTGVISRHEPEHQENPTWHTCMCLGNQLICYISLLLQETALSSERAAKLLEMSDNLEVLGRNYGELLACKEALHTDLAACQEQLQRLQAELLQVKGVPPPSMESRHHAPGMFRHKSQICWMSMASSVIQAHKIT